MKEINMNVPLFNQPSASSHCNIACVRMIMAFNGDFITHEELIKNFPEINSTRMGISPLSANFLVKNGYKVFFSTNQFNLSNTKLANKTELDLKFFRELLESQNENLDFVLQLKKIILFYRSWGKVFYKINYTKRYK